MQWSLVYHNVPWSYRDNLIEVVPGSENTSFHSVRKKRSSKFMYEHGPGKNKQSLPINTVISHGFPAD